MIAYLLRHGEAEDIGLAAPTDAERRLTPEGRERLRRAGRTWRRTIGTPDRIYASPLVRAQETAELLAQALGIRTPHEELACLEPEADPERVAQVILTDANRGLASVALVGHEPNLGATLALLVQGRGSIPLKKGMLVGVEIEGGAVRSGRLVCCMTTKLAARLAEKD